MIVVEQVPVGPLLDAVKIEVTGVPTLAQLKLEGDTEKVSAQLSVDPVLISAGTMDAVPAAERGTVRVVLQDMDGAL